MNPNISLHAIKAAKEITGTFNEIFTTEMITPVMTDYLTAAIDLAIQKFDIERLRTELERDKGDVALMKLFGTDGFGEVA